MIYEADSALSICSSKYKAYATGEVHDGRPELDDMNDNVL